MLDRLRSWFAALVHREPVPDVWTRTERERRLEEIAARQRRYLRTALPMLGLLLFGLVVPAPGPLRLAAFVGAGLLAPFALAATVPRR